MTQEKPVLMRRGDSKYTWDDTAAAVGKDYSGGRVRQAQETIAPVSVLRYCEVWEIGNPLYWHEDVAKQAGYKALVVPWSSIKQTFAYGGFWRPGERTRFPVSTGVNEMTANASDEEEQPRDTIPMPPITQNIVTDVQIEFFEAVVVGDRLTTKGNKLANVRVRETRIGFGAFINMESEIVNQRGVLVARVNQGTYNYNSK